MAKPILLIGIPYEDATQERLDALVYSLEKKFNNEYHVLSFTTGEREPMFKVLNPDKIDAKAWDKLEQEIKEIVKGKLEEQENPARIVTLAKV